MILNTSADSSIGNQGTGTTVLAYPVSEEQASGVGSEELISFDSEINEDIYTHIKFYKVYIKVNKLCNTIA